MVWSYWPQVARAVGAAWLMIAAVPQSWAVDLSGASVDAIVGLQVKVPADARTAETLGTRRMGSGVVLDQAGLVLTIGYLIIEASSVEIMTRDGRTSPAEPLAFDQESGLGLVRSLLPLNLPFMPLGQPRSTRIGERLVVLSHTGGFAAQPIELADRRLFAGYWEYLLDDALFTMPPHRDFAGAALVDGGGRLLGIGSLFVADATGAGVPSPGNMFVPVDALRPVFAELLALGRRDGPHRPWLGVNLMETTGGLQVLRAAADAPAASAGLRPGDLVTALAGQPVSALAEFYRRLWGSGEAGVVVPLTIRRGGETLVMDVKSVARERWLRPRPSL